MQITTKHDVGATLYYLGKDQKIICSSVDQINTETTEKGTKEKYFFKNQSGYDLIESEKCFTSREELIEQL